MKMFRWSLMAVVMLFACSVRVQAASAYSNPKEELKAELCSLPVMAIDQMKFEVLKSAEIGYCLEVSFENRQSLFPIMLMENRCDRITRAENLPNQLMQTKSKPTSIARYCDPVNEFRLRVLLC